MEPTLNLARDDYRGIIGGYLGWGRDPAGWDERQAVEVDDNLGSAQRKFYFQAKANPDDPHEPVYQWSFLKPVAAVAVAAGEATTDLPDDFDGFAGRATLALADGTSGGFLPLDERHEEQLRALYAAAPGATGRPQFFAEAQVKGTGPHGSNRSRLYVYPLPDAAYVFSVPYAVAPNFVTAARPFPYGGAAHAETMKAACRAQAEGYLDNRRDVEQANYRQALAASISYDRRHQPKTLGPNRDLSDLALHGRWGGRFPDGLWHPLGVGYLGIATY